MSYSDFNLSQLEGKFNLVIRENAGFFANINPVKASANLAEILPKNLNLALAINTEKARSEFLIAPILAEIKFFGSQSISLFSGLDFEVDKNLGLNGFCDYILSQSEEQLYLKAPVTVIVEAKKEDLNAAIPQCLAAMIAAQMFNERKNQSISPVYGVVTIGNLWKFLQLEQQLVTIDLGEYYILPVEQILGILTYMISSS